MSYDGTNNNGRLSEKLPAVQTSQTVSDTDIHMKEHEKNTHEKTVMNIKIRNCFESDNGGM